MSKNIFKDFFLNRQKNFFLGIQKLLLIYKILNDESMDNGGCMKDKDA